MNISFKRSTLQFKKNNKYVTTSNLVTAPRSYIILKNGISNKNRPISEFFFNCLQNNLFHNILFYTKFSIPPALQIQFNNYKLYRWSICRLFARYVIKYSQNFIKKNKYFYFKMSN